MSQCKSVSSSASASRSLGGPFLAVVMATVLCAGSAGAQTRAAAPLPRATVSSGTGADKAQPTTITYKQKTTFDFDDDQVEGATVQPGTDLITGRTKSPRESLIRVRTTFQPEMLKSVESL